MATRSKRRTPSAGSAARPETTVSDVELDALFERLHLTNTRRIWRQLVARAGQERWTHHDLLASLASQELAHREQARVVPLMRQPRPSWQVTLSSEDLARAIVDRLLERAQMRQAEGLAARPQQADADERTPGESPSRERRATQASEAHRAYRAPLRIARVEGWDRGPACVPESHATARWVRAILPMVESPRDLRTLPEWGRLIAASPGAIRSWCRTANVSARRSLIFGRLLRAVVLSDGGRRKPENLLDIVDRRTLERWVRRAGFASTAAFPAAVHTYLERQQLIDDAEAVRQIRVALNERPRGRPLELPDR